MKEKNKDTPNKIELRSEKVRKLIGEVPISLVRWSTAIIIIIFFVLICALVFIPSPYGEPDESIFKYIIRNL